MVRTPEHYYGEAERCRKIAEGLLDGESRANLIEVARQYEKLAETAAAKLEKTSPLSD